MQRRQRRIDVLQALKRRFVSTGYEFRTLSIIYHRAIQQKWLTSERKKADEKTVIFSKKVSA